MTNDISLKGFWPPEAKVVVDSRKKYTLTKTHYLFIIDSVRCA